MRKLFMARGKLIIVMLVILICAVIVFGIVKNSKSSSTKDEDNVTENDVELHILEVTDFQNNKAVNKVEATYSVKDKITRIYQNDKYVGDSNLAVNIDIGLMEFKPETRLDEINFTPASIEKYKTNTDYVYNVDIETSEYYVASLIKESKYNILRRVNTPTYCEAYLEDNKGNILRVIATSDTLVMANLQPGLSIKDIMSYFERMEVKEDEN